MTALTLDIEYLPEYADKNSDEYKKLVAQIQQTLLEALKNAGVTGVQVVSLESGSVVVKFVLGLNDSSINISVINAAINTAINNGALSALNATGNVTVVGK